MLPDRQSATAGRGQILQYRSRAKHSKDYKMKLTDQEIEQIALSLLFNECKEAESQFQSVLIDMQLKRILISREPYNLDMPAIYTEQRVGAGFTEYIFYSLQEIQDTTTNKRAVFYVERHRKKRTWRPHKV